MVSNRTQEFLILRYEYLDLLREVVHAVTHVFWYKRCVLG